MTEQTPRDLAAEVMTLNRRFEVLLTGCENMLKTVEIDRKRILALESRRDPDPVCAQTCPACGGDGLAKYTDPNAVTWHRCQTCMGTGLVPAAEPAPLDPVNMAVNELCDIVSSLAAGTVHMIGGNVAGKIMERVEVIRAGLPDGKDGAR